MVLSVPKPVAHLNERSMALLIQVGHGRGVEVCLMMTAYFSYRPNVLLCLKVVIVHLRI